MRRGRGFRTVISHRTAGEAMKPAHDLKYGWASADPRVPAQSHARPCRALVLDVCSVEGHLETLASSQNALDGGPRAGCAGGPARAWCALEAHRARVHGYTSRIVCHDERAGAPASRHAQRVIRPSILRVRPEVEERPASAAIRPSNRARSHPPPRSGRTRSPGRTAAGRGRSSGERQAHGQRLAPARTGQTGSGRRLDDRHHRVSQPGPPERSPARQPRHAGGQLGSR